MLKQIQIKKKYKKRNNSEMEQKLNVFIQNSYKKDGYKKQINNVTKLMKQFEKQDIVYLKNLRQNIEYVQKEIRRTDTVFDKDDLSDSDD